jgi:methionyl-tRNA synthetase
MIKNFFISTAISYTNGPPHMGHAYEIIAADVIARFNRLQSKNVFFLTGTDEHGLKVQQKANKLEISSQELANQMSKKFIDMGDGLNCSNDDFIRTSEERHKKAVKEIWLRMKDNGDIYLDDYSGWYSIIDEAFYQESELIKNNLGELLSPNKTPVEWVEEKSYFFRLSAYEEKLLDLYESDNEFIQPPSRMNEVRNFVKGGLKDISISRKGLEWGVDVPDDKSHSIYVWVDALTNYISALQWPDGGKLYDNFWPGDLHLIGKDIIRFHAVYWPAFLLSAGLPIPKKIFAHGFILNKGEKMSKSLGNIEDPMSLIESFGVDQLRYFLMREIPFGSDGNYSDKLLINRVNADLSNDLGNLSQRCLSMVKKNCNQLVPSKGELMDVDLELLNSIELKKNNIIKVMDNFQISSYLSEVFDTISDTNKYFSNQKPWELKSVDEGRMNTVLWVTCEMLRRFGILLQPVIPSGSSMLLGLLSISEKERTIDFLNDDYALIPGDPIQNPEVIFPKIELKE